VDHKVEHPRITAEEVRRAATDGDDFGHEMRTLGVIRSFSNLSYEHGGTYVDSVTKKARQFDFRVWAKDDTDCFVRLAIEAKNLAEGVPVVVSGCARRADESYHELYIGGVPGTEDYPRRLSPSRRLYPPDEFVGKSLMRLRRTKGSGGKLGQLAAEPDSDVYDRWAQALASAYGLFQVAGDDTKVGRKEQRTLIIPVVVVPNGRLWKIRYDQDGAVLEDPSEVDECHVYVEHRFEWRKDARYMRQYTISHFHLVTLTGLTFFLNKISTYGAEGWSSWFIQGSG
jgi:hypothetical protein